MSTTRHTDTVEVILKDQRRRRWSPADKAALVDAVCSEPVSPERLLRQRLVLLKIFAVALSSAGCLSFKKNARVHQRAQKRNFEPRTLQAPLFQSARSGLHRPTAHPRRPATIARASRSDSLSMTASNDSKSVAVMRTGYCTAITFHRPITSTIVFRRLCASSRGISNTAEHLSS